MVIVSSIIIWVVGLDLLPSWSHSNWSRMVLYRNPDYTGAAFLLIAVLSILKR